MQYHFLITKNLFSLYRSGPSEVFLRKSVLKICSIFTGEHPYRSAISIKLESDFIEIALRHGCSPVNMVHIFRTPFPKSTYGGLLLSILSKTKNKTFLSFKSLLINKNVKVSFRTTWER